MATRRGGGRSGRGGRSNQGGRSDQESGSTPAPRSGGVPAKPTVTLGIRPVGATIPELPTYTPTELALLVDEASDLVREHERAAGAQRQKAADFLFRKLFLNSVRLALDPQAPTPPGVAELLERTGKSFVLSAYEFRRYVLVAAMNHHLRSGVWDGLPFETKLELVRLITDARSFEAFEAAVLVAVQSNAGSRAVREYVNRLLPEKVEGRPRGLTLPGLGKVTAPVVRLENEDQRGRLAMRIAEMSDGAAQEALLGEIEKASGLLAQLVIEVRAERQKLRRRARNGAQRPRSDDA